MSDKRTVASEPQKLSAMKSAFVKFMSTLTKKALASRVPYKKVDDLESWSILDNLTSQSGESIYRNDGLLISER